MDLRRVDLNLLVAFDVLLDERSVTRAADRMCIGQSAMSATLARLRELFDDELLVRQGRQLAPTPVAERLIQPVRSLLAQISDTLESCGGFDPATDARTFKIVASDYVTLVFLRPALRLLAREAPHICLEILPLDKLFADELRRNDVDLLITPAEAFPEYLHFPHQQMFTDRYVCAVSADHPCIQTGLTREAFEQMPYLAMSAGRPPTVVERRLAHLGIAPRTAMTTSFTLGLFLLEGTQFVTLVQERLARAVERQLDIRVIEPPFQLGRITEQMVWTERKTGDPGHRWLRGRLSDLAKVLFAEDGGSGRSVEVSLKAST